MFKERPAEDLGMLLDFIKNAYDTFEQYHISVTALIVATLVLFITLLFAMREAASWFFKIDDIKRDVRKLHALTVELEAELRLIQDLVLKGPPKEQSATAPSLTSPSKTAKPASFPFNH
jgi:hypothetical protein